VYAITRSSNEQMQSTMNKSTLKVNMFIYDTKYGGGLRTV